MIILGYLNERTGKSWRARNPNGTPTAMTECVMARLREGYTVEDYRRVIDYKWREWGSSDQWRKYVNPETLSRKSHFAKYLGECEESAAPAPSLALEPSNEGSVVPVVADPERIREALNKGWEILRGGRKVG